MSGTTANDPFEIDDDYGSVDSIQDTVTVPSTSHSLESAAPLSSAQRNLPSGFSAGGVNASVDKSRQTSTSKEPSSSSRVWIPPPRNPALANLSSAKASSPSRPRQNGPPVPVVGGSGARVPNQFLDDKGEFKRIPQNDHAIDLTADDGLSDDDEPQLVRVKTGDVVADEVKNNGPVCLGVVQAVVLCMFGCPEPIAADGPATKDPSKDIDPLWSRQNWPGASRWFLEPGFRPVLIKIKYAANGPGYNGQTTAQWNYGGSATKLSRGKAEMTVSVMLSPLAHQYQQSNAGIPPSQLRDVPHVKEPFGTLSEKFVTALEPLMARGIVQCEARCRLVERGRAGNFIHPVQILLFCMRPSVSVVSEALSQAGITLEQPQVGSYHPSDYKGDPPLVNPHGSLPSANSGQQAARNRFQPAQFLGNGGSYTSSTQSRETTEEERRKQVETVYDQLVAGEDLPLTEPSNLIATQLFPHQKQGLTFLLSREQEKNFEEAGEVEPRQDASIDLTTGDDVTKDSVGLWKVIRSATDNSIRAYRNVLTQHEQQTAPEICRGALLADDMGLGKTITVISLIATTVREARSFERAKPSESVAEKTGMEGESDDEEELDIGDMAAGLQSMSSKKRKKSNTRPRVTKKLGKREAGRMEAERARRENLVTRSRATLIVCPLTIVSNWEDQLKEHWDRKRPPKIYIYHGTSRSDDPRWIADHDVVLTTYATLASEFSNQSVWVEELAREAESENAGDDSDDEDDDFEMLNDRGEPYESSAGAKKKRRKTGKRKRGGKESFNPLQRIDWFRVVLDEAHTIKEVRTMQCRAVCNLTAQRRLSLTGTPIQNRLDDLYAQIRFLRLHPFSDRFVWNEHCGQRQKRGYMSARANANSNNEPLEQVALVKVQTIMKFLTLRRTKETKTATGAKLLELPPKNTRIVTIEFDERERARYKELHERYKEDFKEMEAAGNIGSNYATILQEISNLRICCDDPALVDASKDLKRLREGRADFSSAIKEDGLTRERAAGLFEVFSEAGGAECAACGTDLTSFVEEAGVREEASDDPSTARVRPVVTRCLHIFCSKCFAKAVPEWKQYQQQRSRSGGSKDNRSWGDQQCQCPSCDQSLRMLLDVLQLEGSEFGPASSTQSVRTSAQGTPAPSTGVGDRPDDTDDFDWGSDCDQNGKKGLKASQRSKEGFGCDRDVPIEERSGLSHKIRFLLNDLVPISMSNPNAFLYDPKAPRLIHYVPTEADREAANGTKLESVVTVPLTENDQAGESKAAKPIKSVVFSQWTTMLDRIEQALYRAGIKTARLDGKMRRPERAAALEMFKKDNRCEVFLISLRAGGFGLNLVSACRAYCIEPAWNPAQEQQAMDRVHRLGQVTPVIATKVVTKDSIETRMLEVQKRKQELANKVAEKRGVGATTAATREEEREQRREEIRTLMG